MGFVPLSIRVHNASYEVENIACNSKTKHNAHKPHHHTSTQSLLAHNQRWHLLTSCAVCYAVLCFVCVCDQWKQVGQQHRIRMCYVRYGAGWDGMGWDGMGAWYFCGLSILVSFSVVCSCVVFSGDGFSGSDGRGLRILCMTWFLRTGVLFPMLLLARPLLWRVFRSPMHSSEARLGLHHDPCSFMTLPMRSTYMGASKTQIRPVVTNNKQT